MRPDLILNRAKGMLGGFTAGQRAVVLIGVLALLLGGYAVTRWVAQPTLSPLFSNLSGTDASAVVDELQSQGVTYKLADGGGTVLVPESQVYNLRVALAGKGIPANEGSGEVAGWSLLDKQGITATDFQQNVAFRRALEGELDKTLQAINGVNTAVVHIAIPQKDVFSDDSEKTTASVLLSLKPGAQLGNDQVTAVTNLVAGSVAGLDPGQVTITDATGKLLSSPTGTGASAAAAASQTDEQTAQVEGRLSKAVQQVLDQVVGPGNAVVRVNAQLDFSSRDTTSEKYAQPTPTAAPLSAATVDEQYSGSGSSAGGGLGQVAPSALAGSNGGAYSRKQSTVNNSVDKTVERATAAPGSIQRLSVAVILNARTAGTLNTAQVQSQVAAAVGLDPKRGDVVQVDALPFDTTAQAAASKEIAAADKAAKTASYVELGKKAGIGLLVVVGLILMLRRGRKDAPIEATASDLPASGLVLPPALAGAFGPAGAIGAGGAGADAGQAALTAGPSRDQIRQDVAALVDNQPDEVAEMLQGWLSERGR